MIEKGDEGSGQGKYRSIEKFVQVYKYIKGQNRAKKIMKEAK